MLRHPYHGLGCLVLVLTLTCELVTIAEPEAPRSVSRPTVQISGFKLMLSRVAQAATAGEWKKPGWTDAVLEAELHSLMEEVRKTTGDAELRLPVGFGDVKPLVAGRGNVGPAEQQLWVLSGLGAVSSAKRCIFLVDGSIRISFADDCIIIARGAVEIAHGKGNIVLAGQYIHVSHDGGPREGGGGILMAGNVVDVSHAHGSICSSPGVVRISHANGVTFLNSPVLELSHQAGCREVENNAFTRAPDLPQNPLDDRLNVTQAVPPEDSGKKALAVIEREGIELVVRPGNPIRDGGGNVIPELEGWQLSYVGDDVAIFSDGQQDALFDLHEH